MREKNNELSRRVFLRRTAASAAAVTVWPQFARATGTEAVKRVHVVFKTHLDIGFTDLAANVVKKYLHEFMPMAIRLARETRELPGDRRFKWTTGSWLIQSFLEQADRTGRQTLETAIEAGDICWHAMPFTTHSEVLDASVFAAGLQLSQRLDERFGRNTISAKMTDVPGHTRGIVPILRQAGVKLLHIGVNPASTPPAVPPVFVWQAPDGSRISVMYQQDYGGIRPLPGTDEAVAIMFTGDNHGPQTVEQVVDAYHRIQAQFPDAEVAASDLNDVAKTLQGVMDRLPVVTGELGDSWIHGIGSDPLKIAHLRELSRLRNEWLSTARLEKHSDTDLAFSLPLCMVGEHTWGLDVKTHLQAWDIYRPEELAAARKTPPFQRIESSWQEKRNYLLDGIKALPKSLKAEAETALSRLQPVIPDRNEYKPVRAANALGKTDSLAFALDPATGSLAHLENRRTGRNWASHENPLALFAYQTFSTAHYHRFMEQYLTTRPDWALSDFGKPGMQAFHPRSGTHLPRIQALGQREEQEWLALLAELQVVDDVEKPVPGCPRQLTVEYRFHRTEPLVEIILQWFGKPANRLPEALWFSFVPKTLAGGEWTLDKMGQAVEPGEVVRNGGHKVHAVAEGVRYTDERGSLFLKTYDAPLVAPGERNLLTFDNARPAPEAGMHFCLGNNVWGTNFVMWFEDDMRFRFALRC